MATAVRRPASRSGAERSWAPSGNGDAHVLVALVLAMAGSAALRLWLTRDTTFWVDELAWLSTTPDLDPRGALDPYVEHLILTSRLIYAAILNLFGASYLPFRLLTAGVVLLTAGLFFVFARRRIGAVLALAPTLVLLFYGSDSVHVLSGNSLTVLLSVSSGIGALLALDREDRGGDIAACLLLCVAVATYSEGLPYVAGAAVFVLLGSDRRRRAWVFLVPGLLYVAWWAWSNAAFAQESDSALAFTNLLLAPSWAVESLAAVAAGLLGLNYSFGFEALLGVRDSGWGTVVALAALVGLGWRVGRGDVPRWLWATMAVPATFWLLHSIAAAPEAGRGPGNHRYLFAGTVAVLLVAVEAARGVRFGRAAIFALYAAAIAGLATNIAWLRDSSQDYVNDADRRRATLTAIELADRVGPVARYRLIGEVMRETGETHVTTGYDRAVRRFGSPAFSLPELREQDDPIRQSADTALADSLGVGLEPGSAIFAACRRVSGERGQQTRFELPPGGAVLRTDDGIAPLLLRRFASEYTVEAGQLRAGVPASLAVSRDRAPDPWYASTPAKAVEVCPVDGG